MPLDPYRQLEIRPPPRVDEGRLSRKVSEMPKMATTKLSPHLRAMESVSSSYRAIVRKETSVRIFTWQRKRLAASYMHRGFVFMVQSATFHTKDSSQRKLSHL